ncbi:MAG: GIY-YIG nuclease family protein [Flavobacteriales bacterium]
MFYLYILYSASADKYYVGYSVDPRRRLQEHNENDGSTFTGKFNSWELRAVFSVSEIEGIAMQMERFIKKQKSRKLIERLCDVSFIPSGRLAQLVRVPHERD